jgi:hypothetical protein
MRFKSLITLILTASLAVITSNAMAKSDKSDKSAKSAKSDKSGKGLGHCKSDKSGKGHSKKRGKGHDRDCDDDNPPQPPVRVCVAIAGDVVEFSTDEERFDSRGGSLGFFTTSVSFTGPICAIGEEVPYQADVSADGGATVCNFSNSLSSVSGIMQSETEFWYDMTTVLECRDFVSN